MRIGDFAKKYGMNVTAIRYYIDNALLTPQKKNNQYVFDQGCIDDMDKILEYKECGLTLEEIELLFFLEKTSKFQDETILQIVRELFEEKIDVFRDEQSKIQKSIELLEDKLKKFSSIQVQKQDESSAGIPFSFIPYLYCPKCGAPLSMSNTTIHNGHLYDRICALLRDTGLLIGLIGDYKDAPKSVQNIKKDHPDYPAEKMPPSRFRANMKTNGLELQEMKLVGSTHGNEMHFPRNEVGEQVSMLGYTAVKK